MENKNLSFVFFGSSDFSKFVLDELDKAGLKPILNITSSKEDLPMDKLKEINAELFIVASFGKILPKDLIDMPKFGTLNVHPSLLPILRGPAPIQGTILGLGNAGVTIIKMDEKMDHGPILAQKEIPIEPFPDHYAIVEEKLARAGGKLLISILENWMTRNVAEKVQDESKATYIKMIKKEDGQLDLSDPPEKNLRKVFAYSKWPGAHIFFTKKTGEEIRVVIKNAKIIEGVFIPTRVIPAGKKEMDWQDFLRGNA